MITTGSNKISFLQFCIDEKILNHNSAEDGAAATSQATMRYESFIPRHLSQIRMPLIKPTTKMYSIDSLAEFVTSGGTKQRKIVILSY